ncbi:MAG: hypothetical protein MUC97_12515 [Bernardetiaceae bacterium]|jgi:hypothetical protein|nr:hypothetical protein [Bernardetiaceae bacterium]
MKKAAFRDWTLTKLDKAFGLKEVRQYEVMTEWQGMEIPLSDYERQVLADLQAGILRAGKAWNETELENKFISPLIIFTKIDTDEFGYFLERPLQGIVGDYELSGIVDGMIASGFRDPDVPFFCMHEYKRSVDNEGNPDAQALAAMLVARELNGQQKPVYGLYVVGLIWNFMVLNGQQYCISRNYDASNEDIYDIFRLMKGLKTIVQTRLLPQSVNN